MLTLAAISPGLQLAHACKCRRATPVHHGGMQVVGCCASAWRGGPLLHELEETLLLLPMLPSNLWASEGLANHNRTATMTLTYTPADM